MYKNHTTSLRLREMHPLFLFSPDGGEVLRTYHLYLKPSLSIDAIGMNRYFTDGKFKFKPFPFFKNSEKPISQNFPSKKHPFFRKSAFVTMTRKPNA